MCLGVARSLKKQRTIVRSTANEHRHSSNLIPFACFCRAYCRVGATDMHTNGLRYRAKRNPNTLRKQVSPMANACVCLCVRVSGWRGARLIRHQLISTSCWFASAMNSVATVVHRQCRLQLTKPCGSSLAPAHDNPSGTLSPPEIFTWGEIWLPPVLVPIAKLERQ